MSALPSGAPRSPDRFETLPAMLLAGLSQHHGFADAARDIPVQWAAFRAATPLVNVNPAVTFGAMCGTDLPNQRFEYMCAVEVSTFDGLDTSIRRMRVPASTYAVFSHAGHVSALRDTWGAVHAWLAGNGAWRDANTPDFERYDARYDATTGTGGCEIWVPVVSATL